MGISFNSAMIFSLSEYVAGDRTYAACLLTPHRTARAVEPYLRKLLRPIQEPFGRVHVQLNVELN